MLAFAFAMYWTDRYEKEPIKLLGGVFLWGAVVAAGGAFILNTSLGLGIFLFTGSEAFTEISTSSAIAPVIEESLKGIACLIVFFFFRREFDSILDGIVYAAITAIGFAATENVYYLYTYGFQEEGVSGILWMFFIRVILVGWQHPFYTSFIGIGLAVARLNSHQVIKFLAPITGWGLAVFTHSFHNTISHLFEGIESYVVGMVLDWSGWIAMAIFILWALYREQRWIITQLGEEVGKGIITPMQYKTACSARAQTIARLHSLFSKNYRLTDRFYRLTAELAYKKQQVASMDEQEGFYLEVDHLRTELGSLSSQISA